MKTAREAVRPTSLLAGPVREKALRAMAAAIAEKEEAILAANETDVDAVGKSMTGYENRERVRDAVARIRMTADDVKALVDRLHRIADLPDPLGEVLGRHDEPNGLQVGRVRVPIGLIGIVSELSPLETIEAVALCLKSGNVCVFRGSPDWTHTQEIIAAALTAAMTEAGIPGCLHDHRSTGEGSGAGVDQVRQGVGCDYSARRRRVAQGGAGTGESADSLS
ncbi:MAG: hypothetical protein MRJ92_09125 [Nitrospira sp.]|nr:hypothetical protein [Nitrospira sp.]